MYRAFVVSYGTRKVIVRAESQADALRFIVDALSNDAGPAGRTGPDESDLRVRPAEPGDFSTIDYYSHATRARQRLVSALGPPPDELGI